MRFLFLLLPDRLLPLLPVGHLRRPPPRTKKIVRLLQYLLRVHILLANNIHRIVVKEPAVAAMFARADDNLRFVRLRKKKDDGVIDPLRPYFEIEALVGAEVRHDAQLVFFDPRFLLEFPQSGVDAPFARLEVPFREIPIIAAAIEKKEFYPVARFAINDKPGHHLLFCGNTLGLVGSFW